MQSGNLAGPEVTINNKKRQYTKIDVRKDIKWNVYRILSGIAVVTMRTLLTPMYVSNRV